MSEVKRHYIADESLGGIEREYVEVERKAYVGDYVHVTKFADEQADVIVKIDKVDEYGDFIAYPVDKHMYDRLDLDRWDEYKTLSPTNIIRHHGQRYEMVDRKAEVGEKILHMYGGKSDGIVTEITDVGVSKVDVEEYDDGDGDMVCAIDHGAYRVLTPLDNAPQSPQSTDDIIANLVARLAKAERKIAELSEQVGHNTDNIRTWAEDYSEHKADISDKVEMLTEDIAMLDERTQLLTTEGVSKLSEELAQVVTEAIDEKLRKGWR